MHLALLRNAGITQVWPFAAFIQIADQYRQVSESDLREIECRPTWCCASRTQSDREGRCRARCDFTNLGPSSAVYTPMQLGMLPMVRRCSQGGCSSRKREKRCHATVVYVSNCIVTAAARVSPTLIVTCVRYARCSSRLPFRRISEGYGYFLSNSNFHGAVIFLFVFHRAATTGRSLTNSLKSSHSPLIWLALCRAEMVTRRRAASFGTVG
jgi:hypothetical protein